jgi:hypothetical protein
MADYRADDMSMTLRPIRGVAQAVSILLGSQIVIAVAEAVALLHRIDLLRRIQDGASIAVGDGSTADTAVSTAAAFDLLAFLATIIVWCIWQHRAQSNAIQLTTGGLQFTPGWAVGWWFIPIVNLWKPFQTVRELWKASHGGDAWRSMRTWPVIGWWWATWMASLVHVWFGENGGSIGFGTMPLGTPTSAGDVINRDAWLILSLALRVVAAILAIAIVRAVVRAQENAPPRTPMTLQPHGPGLPDLPTRPDM